MDQKLEFAERLQAAMRAAGLEPRPAVLLNLFNANYWGAIRHISGRVALVAR